MKNHLFISSELHASAGALSDILNEIRSKIDEEHFDVSPYSKELTDIGIIVNCFPDDWLLKGFGKPRKYISYKNGYADIRLPVPYVEMRNADKEKRYLMAVRNIVDSIAVIGEKCAKSKRASFDSDGMIKEILNRLGISREELEGVNGVISEMPEL